MTIKITLPDATQHNPDENYLRELISKSGLSIGECARRVGVTKSNFKQMLDSKHNMKAPYAVQYCLEILSENTCDTSPQEVI